MKGISEIDRFGVIGNAKWEEYKAGLIETGEKRGD